MKFQHIVNITIRVEASNWDLNSWPIGLILILKPSRSWMEERLQCMLKILMCLLLLMQQCALTRHAVRACGGSAAQVRFWKWRGHRVHNDV